MSDGQYCLSWKQHLISPLQIQTQAWDSDKQEIWVTWKNYTINRLRFPTEGTDVGYFSEITVFFPHRGEVMLAFTVTIFRIKLGKARDDEVSE